MAEQQISATGAAGKMASSHTRRGGVSGDAVFRGITTFFAFSILLVAVAMVLTLILNSRKAITVMIVPTVAAISRDVIRVVPDSQREAMLALGATRWEMIWKTVLPYARPGIIGALILALGRAVGETIAATMVIGNASYVGLN